MIHTMPALVDETATAGTLQVKENAQAEAVIAKNSRVENAINVDVGAFIDI